MTVTASPITVSAQGVSRIYGDAKPALGYTVGGLGLVNGDGLTGALATSEGLASGVGTYAITLGSLTEGTRPGPYPIHSICPHQATTCGAAATHQCSK